jgi:hypothetical protein
MARREYPGLPRKTHRTTRHVIRRPYFIAGLLASVLGVGSAGSDTLSAPPEPVIESMRLLALSAPPPPLPRPTPAPETLLALETSGGNPRLIPVANDEQSPITVEKRGGGDEVEEEKEAPRVFWFFGGDKYVTGSVRRAIDAPSVRKGRWRYIVVHNSGTRQGNARAFDYYHRRVRHMPNGLAYQFVIGNGHGSGDGKIEIGNRWTQQLSGGHCASDYLNNIAIGICLVGDFNRDLPTKAQLASLEELIKYLRKRVGRVDRQLAIVKAHREINPKPTDCPGNRFPVRWMHRKFD